MYNFLDQALKLEKKHGPYRDPKLFKKEADYAKYRPLGVCVTMRDNGSDLVTRNQWPVLAKEIPVANLEEVPSSGKRRILTARTVLFVVQNII